MCFQDGPTEGVWPPLILPGTAATNLIRGSLLTILLLKTDNMNAQMMCICFFFPVARAQKQVKYSINLDKSTFKHKLPRWQVKWSFRPSYNMWNMSCLSLKLLHESWSILNYLETHQSQIPDSISTMPKWSDTEFLGFQIALPQTSTYWFKYDSTLLTDEMLFQTLITQSGIWAVCITEISAQVLINLNYLETHQSQIPDSISTLSKCSDIKILGF